MATITDIGIHPQFAGSKKKLRRFERLAKDLESLIYMTDAQLDTYLEQHFPDETERGDARVIVIKDRCARIYKLAQQLKSEEELDLYLGQIPDDEVRAEVRKWIEPFCPFKIRQPVVVATPGQAAAVALASVAPTPKANADGVLPHEKDFRESERRLTENDLSQDQKVRAVAEWLAKSFELPVLQLIRDEGFETFRLKARNAQFYVEKDGTLIDYNDDDLRRIYGYVLRELDAREARKDTRLVTH